MKKFLTLALALIMVLALAACGEKTSTPSNSSDPGTSQQTEQPSNTPDESTPSDSNNDGNKRMRLHRWSLARRHRYHWRPTHR